MALDLERVIMRRIGLDQPAYWYAGSSCYTVRRNAVHLLPRVINEVAEKGEGIAKASALLCGLLIDANEVDLLSGTGPKETIEVLWMVASEVIRAHIILHDDKETTEDSCYKSIWQHYLFPHQSKFHNSYDLGYDEEDYPKKWRK